MNRSPAASALAPTAPASPARAAWHAGWAAATGLAALGAAWIGQPGAVVIGALVMAAPGLLGLGLLQGDTPRRRALLLAGWGLAAIGTAALTGGLAGPLAALVFAPLIAGAVLGRARLIQAGALASALAAGAGAAVAPEAAPPAPALTAAVGAAAALFAGLAARFLLPAEDGRQAAARASVARVEAVLAGQPGLTLVLSPAGQALAAYGSAPPALAVDPLFEDGGLLDAVHAPDRPAVAAALDKARTGQEAQARFAPRAALDRRVLLIVRALERGEDGRLIAVLLDATLAHAREAGLEAARAEAEAQSAGKSRFLAHMSHELRTPLNAVIGFSDVMRQRLFGPLPDRYADYAVSIHEAGRHLLDLINDVLDVSKIEAERYELQIERFDAREVVSAALALVRIQADDKGVLLSALLPDRPVPVAADRRALKQMTVNLLANAVKFTPSGGAVTVGAEALGEVLELTVADTGVGIAPEDLARLGRPYEQAGDAEQRAQGAGLGLALVRSLAKLHGGVLALDSTPGEGTAAVVRLPVVTAAREPVEGGAEIIPLNRSA